MSQVCPSSSHQLAAAAIAFRRARRKFPRNYGLSSDFEDSSKFNDGDSDTTNENSHYEENLPVSSVKRPSTNSRASYAVPVTVSSNDCGEKATTRKSSLQNPIICSCCLKRNRPLKLTEPFEIEKSETERSAGDAIITVLGREQIKQPLTAEEEIPKRHLCHETYPKRRTLRETSSKSKSINLSCAKLENKTDVKYCSSLDSYVEDRKCSRLKTTLKSNRRPQLELCSARVEHHTNCDSSCSIEPDLTPETSNFYEVESNGSRKYYVHRECQCTCYSNLDRKCNSSSRSKHSEAQASFHSSPDAFIHRNHSPVKGHDARSSVYVDDCCSLNFDKTGIQDSIDDEVDDGCVGVINHKDSLCILVEKFKAQKKSKHRKFLDERKTSSNESNEDDYEKPSHATYHSGISNVPISEQKPKKISNENSHAYRECSKRSMEKMCRHGCGENSQKLCCYHEKSLKSRLMKSAVPCSSKGSPWRRTF